MLAEKGTGILYAISSNTRDHITTSYTISASGSMVPPHCVFKGVRNMASKYLSELPQNGLSGKWGFSVAPKVFISYILIIEVFTLRVL